LELDEMCVEFIDWNKLAQDGSQWYNFVKGLNESRKFPMNQNECRYFQRFY